MWHKTQHTENLFGGRTYLTDPTPPAHAPASVSLYQGNEYSLWWKFASRGQPLRKSGLSCHLCDKLFGHRLFGLISHYALYHFRQALRDQHADGDTKMRVCRVCGLELSSGQGLVNHLAVRHDLVRPLLPPHVWERIENFRSGGGGEGDDS